MIIRNSTPPFVLVVAWLLLLMPVAQGRIAPPASLDQLALASDAVYVVRASPGSMGMGFLALLTLGGVIWRRSGSTSQAHLQATCAVGLFGLAGCSFLNVGGATRLHVEETIFGEQKEYIYLERSKEAIACEERIEFKSGAEYILFAKRKSADVFAPAWPNYSALELAGNKVLVWWAQGAGARVDRGELVSLIRKIRS